MEEGRRQEVSNLGSYQTMTQLAKAAGGPEKLAIATAVGGYITFRIVEETGCFAYKKIKGVLAQGKNGERSNVYEVKHSCQDESGLCFNVGDKYRILTTIEEGVLIEKIGDKQNPYFVSKAFAESLDGDAEGQLR